jgi:putative flippase GtrA
MDKLKEVFLNKSHNNYTQFIRYGFVATASYAVNLVGLVALKQYGHVNYLLAATISFIAGLLVNYALSKFWVFNGSKLHNQTHEFLFFSLIGLVGLGLNDLIFWILTSGLGLFYIFSNVIATFIVDFWNLVPGKNTYLVNAYG